MRYTKNRVGITWADNSVTVVSNWNDTKLHHAVIPKGGRQFTQNVASLHTFAKYLSMIHLRG